MLFVVICNAGASCHRPLYLFLWPTISQSLQIILLLLGEWVRFLIQILFWRPCIFYYALPWADITTDLKSSRYTCRPVETWQRSESCREDLTCLAHSNTAKLHTLSLAPDAESRLPHAPACIEKSFQRKAGAAPSFISIQALLHSAHH